MSTLRTTTTVTTASPCVPSQRQSDSLLLADIFNAYYCARSNKRNTASQVRFERNLSANLIALYEEVSSRSYTPGRSMCFIIRDPVQREIFAASFRDRIIHHYLYNQLEPVFEPAFIYDSYSCRKGKGTLFGIERLEHHLRSCTDNYHKSCYALKLDIEGYFMNIDRGVLFDLISSRMDRLRSSSGLPSGFDYDTVKYLLEKVVFLDPTKGCRIKGPLNDWSGLPHSKSLFHAPAGCGLPIGNLTSQLFSNIYLNELDQFVKRELGFRHYGRYVDDFYIIDESLSRLMSAKEAVSHFLERRLGLRLNQRKCWIYRTDGGIPFLGAVCSPSGRFLRPRNLHRMVARIDEVQTCEPDPFLRAAVLNSYKGYTSHFRVDGKCLL